MGLLSKAFLENLFPKPFEGDLTNGFGITQKNGYDCVAFYFEENYYIKLTKFVKNEYLEGRFSKSNAEEQWVNLMNELENYVNINKIDEKIQNYWLSEPVVKEYETFKIEVDKKFKNNGMYSMLDSTWERINKIENGNLIISENEYKIELNTGEIIVFDKKGDLKMSMQSNFHITTDLELFDVYEKLDVKNGHLLLYRNKKENIKDFFILAGTSGLINDSNIWFKIKK